MQEAVPVGRRRDGGAARARPRGGRGGGGRGGRRARSARPPTTTTRRRWWSRATGPRSSGRWRSPRRGARKRAMMLPVSAPFHCALMQPAAEAMAEALADVAIAAPAVPLVANVTAEAVSDPERDPAAAGRAGDRAGALARERGLDGRRRASTRSSRSAPARRCRGMIRRIAQEIETRGGGQRRTTSRALAA